MARHKRPWCRSCGTRKARRPILGTEGFCSQRCALIEGLVAWDALREGDGLDDWCLRCGRWSGSSEDWVGTHPKSLHLYDTFENFCKCPIPIPSFTGEPYIKEEYDEDGPTPLMTTFTDREEV